MSKIKVFLSKNTKFGTKKMLPRKETSVPLLDYSYMFSRIFISSGILIMTIKSAALT